jgi:hypothetical protein
MPAIDADSSERKTSRRVAKMINGVLSFLEEALKSDVRRSLVHVHERLSPFAVIFERLQ